MSKFPGKILMLTALALFLNAGVALANPPSSDWNDSWGFPTPFEKANLLNQALAIELVENDGFESNFYSTQNCNVDGSCFFGTSLAIGNQVNIDIGGDNNEINDNNLDNDGNVSAQVNNGNGIIEQDIKN
ncbi:MAG: hypothetical protein IID17_02950 [Nitrospinae bacterium]|nr:hypothetical protein [Nitrospinota bacterium]